MRLSLLFLSCLLFVSCTAYKLHVRLDGQPTQAMEARTRKADGFWTVDLVLPRGSWAVTSGEPGIAPRLVESAGRQHVRVELPPGRMLSVKPLELKLQGLNGEGKPSGPPFTVTIDHYSQFQRGSSFS